jgi:CRP-like cAMP-binding protein
MTQIEKHTFLAPLPFCTVLTEEDVAALAQIAAYKTAGKYQFIYMPDEVSNFVYLLIKGKIKTGTFASDGREIIKEVVHPGSLFGDLSLAGEKIRTDYAQALPEGVHYLEISVTQFQCLMESNPNLSRACLQHIYTRVQRVEERLTKVMLKDARERVIEFIVETAGKEGRKVGFETVVKNPFTQQEIANITGTSRQTVTSVFNELRKSNLIHFNRNSILIRDLQKLS